MAMLRRGFARFVGLICLSVAGASMMTVAARAIPKSLQDPGPVHLAATVPGWTRFSVAQEALAKLQGNASSDAAAVAHDVQAFLAQTDRGRSGAPFAQADRDDL